MFNVTEEKRRAVEVGAVPEAPIKHTPIHAHKSSILSLSLVLEE